MADRSKQQRRPGYKKEDAASTTVSNKGVMITAVIEVHMKVDTSSVLTYLGFICTHRQTKKR